MSFWRNTVIQPALNSALDAAVNEQQELLRRDPSNPYAYFALGTLAHLHGNTDAAIPFFLKAIELNPTYAAPRVSLGRIYAVKASYELAWQHAREAERLGDPSLVQQLQRYPGLSRPVKEK
ncbi:MAG TPA: tetratricopeptide repeat protein [Terriglobia bacterium]|nr:tetratricopeptide repeat protein [Terriglobia bacterium]